MKVKDVMTVDVKSCRLETNAAEAVKRCGIRTAARCRS